MKMMRKKEVQNNRMEENVRRELEILKKCQHPFIVEFKHERETDSNLCLVMEYVPGGDLFNLIRK